MGPALTVDGVERIAVLRANALGDFVFALPALEALRAAYPAAEITLLGRAWHADFLADRPSPIDRVEVVPGEAGDAPWLAAPPAELNRFAARLRRRQFDLAIQLHGGGRNSNALIGRFGARVTAGCASADAPALDRVVPYVYYQQEVARCLEVVGLVGATPVMLEARVTSTVADAAAAATVIGNARYAVIHPGATDPRRRWPVDGFVEVGTALVQRRLAVIVTGSDEEAALAATVAERLGPAAVNVAGRTSLSALTGLLSGATVVVANDTGPLHLASALGSPTVGIYWVGNLINGGPMTRSRHRPILSWRTRCPECGVDCLLDRCSHTSSFVADVQASNVLAATNDLLSTLAS